MAVISNEMAPDKMGAEENRSSNDPIPACLRRSSISESELKPVTSKTNKL